MGATFFVSDRAINDVALATEGTNKLCKNTSAGHLFNLFYRSVMPYSLIWRFYFVIKTQAYNRLFQELCIIYALPFQHYSDRECYMLQLNPQVDASIDK